MIAPDEIVRRLKVEPGTAPDLAGRDPAWTGGSDIEVMASDLKELAQERLDRAVEELATAQELLWASNTHAVLVIFQALDAAGKDGTIKHVMSGVNPQGCHVVSFKQPSATERDHTFLWRASAALPERGQIGIFNRSYYEDVIVVRVHPDILDGQQLPAGTPRGDALWRERYDDINAFERHLDRNGTKVVKFFLHVSKDEQRRRFLSRVEEPNKYWKFSANDLAERRHWDEYMAAFEDTLAATSTDAAPWYVIPADHKWVMRALVGGVLARTVTDLGLSYPTVSEQHLASVERARSELLAEG